MKKTITKFRLYIVTLALLLSSITIYPLIDLTQDAHFIIQASYPSEDMKQSILKFVYKKEEISNLQTTNLPSVETIIEKVSELQNKNGDIQDFHLKKQAIDALQAVKSAINKALIYTTENQKLTKFLQAQQKTIEAKLQQINTTSIFSYFTHPTVITGMALTITISGCFYYYKYFYQPKQESDLVTADPIDTHPLTWQDHHTELQEAFFDFINPKNTTPTPHHLERLEKILPKLNPNEDQHAIEIIKTLLEGQHKTNYLSISNATFWKKFYDKTPMYLQSIIKTLNSNPNKIKIYTAQDFEHLPTTVFNRMSYFRK